MLMLMFSSEILLPVPQVDFCCCGTRRKKEKKRKTKITVRRRKKGANYSKLVLCKEVR